MYTLLPAKARAYFFSVSRGYFFKGNLRFRNCTGKLSRAGTGLRLWALCFRIFTCTIEIKAFGHKISMFKAKNLIWFKFRCRALLSGICIDFGLGTLSSKNRPFGFNLGEAFLLLTVDPLTFSSWISVLAWKAFIRSILAERCLSILSRRRRSSCARRPPSSSKKSWNIHYLHVTALISAYYNFMLNWLATSQY